MAHLIDKSALLSEIERMQDAYIAKLENRGMGHEEAVMASISYVNGINDAIDSLEVKEVDFDDEWKRYFEHRGEIATVNVKHLAKHFFELGLRASQPTVSVYGIEEALKENGIDPDSKEADIYIEAIYKFYDRLKVQKGE